MKLLHESEGHVVTVRDGIGGGSVSTARDHLASSCAPAQVELKSGEMYRGELHEAEDNWNVQLANATATGRDGKTSHVEHIFIRGSRVRFVIVPDMLKKAPMFKRIDPKHKMKNVALGAQHASRSHAD